MGFRKKNIRSPENIFWLMLHFTQLSVFNQFLHIVLHCVMVRTTICRCPIPRNPFCTSGKRTTWSTPVYMRIRLRRIRCSRNVSSRWTFCVRRVTRVRGTGTSTGCSTSSLNTIQPYNRVCISVRYRVDWSLIVNTLGLST